LQFPYTLAKNFAFNLITHIAVLHGKARIYLGSRSSSFSPKRSWQDAFHLDGRVKARESRCSY